MRILSSYRTIYYRAAVRGVEQIPWLYDALLAVVERFQLGEWRRWLVHGAVGRTLDIGAGTGRNLPLYPSEVRPIAVEPDRWVLQAARKRAPHVPMILGRAEALPFRDGTFDTVVSGLVFCTVQDPGAGLAEVRRVLKPGGTVRMLEHVRSRNRLVAWVQDLLQPAWTWCAGGCHPNRSTEAAVEAAGFEIHSAGRRRRGTLRRFAARVAKPY